MSSIRRIRSIAPELAWDLVGRGEAQLLDLRTELERRRYGWPPGAPRVSLSRHIARPRGWDTIYLCQHANRSKLTARRGAAEVAGGWPAWQAAGLPIERTRGHERPAAQGRVRPDLQQSSAPHRRARHRLQRRGVLLALRDFGPCKGLWHLPGGTVRFGEPVVDAVRRVARDELGLTVRVGDCSATSSTPATTTTGSTRLSA